MYKMGNYFLDIQYKYSIYAIPKDPDWYRPNPDPISEKKYDPKRGISYSTDLFTRSLMFEIVGKILEYYILLTLENLKQKKFRWLLTL